MTVKQRVKSYLQRKKRLRKIIYKLMILSYSRWIYSKSILQWITDPYYKKQLPLLYQYFASVCHIWIKFIPLKKIIGARPLFLIIRQLQTKSNSLKSYLIKFPNLKVYLNLEDQRFLAVGNELTRGEIDKILSLFISEEDTFVDVGANQGSYSLIATKILGESGSIVSIEPQPQLAANIKKSLEINSICKFEVHQMAVGDTDGTLDLIIPRSSSGAAGLYREHSGIDGCTKLKVPVRRFDDSIDWKNFSGSVFVKLDIEGAELAFLKGAQKMMSTHKPLLFMEINPVALTASETSKEELVTTLQNIGYTHYRYPND
ncbi:FkbM family methyltransferase, partial [bacterium]|nr:FkbM family methyltransferase [bacterium]